MSILVRFSPPSATRGQYDESIRRLEEQGDFPPDGAEYHCAIFADGNLRDPGEPEILEVYNTVSR